MWIKMGACNQKSYTNFDLMFYRAHQHCKDWMQEVHLEERHQGLQDGMINQMDSFR